MMETFTKNFKIIFKIQSLNSSCIALGGVGGSIQAHFVVIFQIHQMEADSCNKSCQSVLTADFVVICIAYYAVTDSVYSFQTVLQYCFCQVITVYTLRNVSSLNSIRNDFHQLLV